MDDKEPRKIEVKVLPIASLWTMGALYTMGVILSSYPEILMLTKLWYKQVIAIVLVYGLWPLILGYLNGGCG